MNSDTKLLVETVGEVLDVPDLLYVLVIHDKRDHSISLSGNASDHDAKSMLAEALSIPFNA